MWRSILIISFAIIFGVALTDIVILDPAFAAEQEAHGSGGHSDPFSNILLELGIILLFALLGRWLAKSANQPAVLGELLIGVVIGNIGYWFGLPVFTLVMHLQDAGAIIGEAWRSGISVPDAATAMLSTEAFNQDGVGTKLMNILTGADAPRVIIMAIALWIFSNLGVILLLFMVGLESHISELAKVGINALIVAIIGVVAPMLLGYLASAWLLPESTGTTHLFIGATLCATSVGITARVFKDLNKLHIAEAKVILGAAIIDDILSLVVLAVVVGIVSTGHIVFSEVGRIIILSSVFLGIVIFFGEKLVGWKIQQFKKIERDNIKLLFPLCLLCFMAWLANQIELATIVGAFAAGLILSEDQFKSDQEGEKTTIEGTFQPLEAIFAPIFFVLMGMQVNLNSFLQPGTLLLALTLTIIAIITKALTGVAAGKGRDKLVVGFGMMPRGEVGLIFASIGKGLGVVNDAVFSAIVIMVMITTFLAPVSLKWLLGRSTVVATD